MKFNKIGKALVKYAFDSNERFWLFSCCGLNKNVSDEVFLKKMYFHDIGEELNLENPQKYTEKLQWLKLYDRRKIYTTMVDKYEVKKYVSDKIGSEYVLPCLGVWESVNEVDFDILPKAFVLKCTHDSGTCVICKDKSTINIKKVKKFLKKRLKRKYYYLNREWAYKNVKPRIIAEPYLEDEYGELRDYKFFTFGGIPKVLYIAQGRNKKRTVADFFDMDFNHMPFTIDHEMANVKPNPPKKFELMKELATKLSEGIPHLRVDFYEVNGKVYFGELTFFHCSGLTNFNPKEWNEIFGSWITLPEKSNERI